jgi:hypothetical protein
MRTMVGDIRAMARSTSGRRASSGARPQGEEPQQAQEELLEAGEDLVVELEAGARLLQEVDRGGDLRQAVGMLASRQPEALLHGRQQAGAEPAADRLLVGQFGLLLVVVAGGRLGGELQGLLREQLEQHLEARAERVGGDEQLGGAR